MHITYLKVIRSINNNPCNIFIFKLIENNIKNTELNLKQ